MCANATIFVHFSARNERFARARPAESQGGETKKGTIEYDLRAEKQMNKRICRGGDVIYARRLVVVFASHRLLRVVRAGTRAGESYAPCSKRIISKRKGKGAERGLILSSCDIIAASCYYSVLFETCAYVCENVDLEVPS